MSRNVFDSLVSTCHFLLRIALKKRRYLLFSICCYFGQTLGLLWLLVCFQIWRLCNVFVHGLVSFFRCLVRSFLPTINVNKMTIYVVREIDSVVVFVLSVPRTDVVGIRPFRIWITIRSMLYHWVSWSILLSGLEFPLFSRITYLVGSWSVLLQLLMSFYVSGECVGLFTWIIASLFSTLLCHVLTILRLTLILWYKQWWHDICFDWLSLLSHSVADVSNSGQSMETESLGTCFGPKWIYLSSVYLYFSCAA